MTTSAELRETNASLWHQLHDLEQRLQDAEALCAAAAETTQRLHNQVLAREDQLDACATAGCELCKLAVAEIQRHQGRL